MYSLRKLSVGLCSVVLGCMLLQNATTKEVKADAGTTGATQAQSASDGTATGESGSNPGGDETCTANEGQQVQGLKASDYQEETKDKFNFHKYDNGTKIDLSPKQNEKEMQNDDGSITLTHVNKGPVMKKDGRVAPFGLIDIKLVRSI
ncbi:YSIRK-type signal peptide-containing protein [Lactobacillus amylovorus]|uniref:YSIRK-type signal peptide-containing protein n=1 Tax=Lactobacillus amylovorus TaxID=1604 RepID=UPI0030C6AD68